MLEMSELKISQLEAGCLPLSKLNDTPMRHDEPGLVLALIL